MGKYANWLLAGLTVYTAYVVWDIFSDGSVPDVPEHFWGKAGQKEDKSVRPFKIQIEEKVLTDLKARLKRELDSETNRFVAPLHGTGFHYGLNTNYLRKFGDYWLNKYDWRPREILMNKYPHFKTQVSGLDIHFQHVKSQNNAKYNWTRPLLLLHGWPGSFLEFQKVIPLLTDPKDSMINFEVIIPSLPGYGFSESAAVAGLGDVEIAQIMLKLMQRLGHDRFYVQAGDLGAVIGSGMAALYHKHVMGIHLNSCMNPHPRSILKRLLVSILPQLFLDANEAKKYSPITTWFTTMMRETGYMHLQATRPDTVGIGLSNSPTALAAYILEKFSAWTNPGWFALEDGGLTHFNKDELLDNLMVYWVTNSITTSMRLYSEISSVEQRNTYGMEKVPTYVPTACLSMPGDLYTEPEAVLGEKFPQIIRYTKADKGGHFAAWEMPDVLTKDVIAFFTHVETSGLSLFERKLPT